MGGLENSLFLHPTQHGKNLHRRELSDGAATNPWKDVVLEAAEKSATVIGSPKALPLFVPFCRDL
jgi:hypothetical protein